MMSRILDNKEFLKSLAHSTTRPRTRALEKATSDQLKAIVECIINVKHIKLSDKEQKCIRKCLPLVKYFNGKSELNVKRLATHLIKNHIQVASLLGCVMLRLFQEAIYCVYNNGDDSSHDTE